MKNLETQSCQKLSQQPFPYSWRCRDKKAAKWSLTMKDSTLSTHIIYQNIIWLQGRIWNIFFLICYLYLNLIKVCLGPILNLVIWVSGWVFDNRFLPFCRLCFCSSNFALCCSFLAYWSPLQKVMNCVETLRCLLLGIQMFQFFH